MFPPRVWARLDFAPTASLVFDIERQLVLPSSLRVSGVIEDNAADGMDA